MERPITQAQARVRTEDIAYRELGDELFISTLPADTPFQYYILRGTGVEMFKLLVQSQTPGQIVENLGSKYHVDPAIVSRDLGLVLERLQAARLVDMEPTSLSGAAACIPVSGAPQGQTANPLEYMVMKAYHLCSPIKVSMELTYACNINCRHCYAPKDKPRLLTTDEIKHALDEMAEAGVLFLTLTGGEVFVRQDFLEIARYARQKNFAITILTNATLIDERVADFIAEHVRPASVEVSVYAANPQIHDDFTRIKGSHARTMRAIKLLSERNVRVYAKHVLNRYNVGERQALRSLMQDWGVIYFATPLLWPNASGALDPTQHRVTDDQLHEIIRDGTFTPHRTLCVTGRARYRVSPDGLLFPCELIRIPLGDLRQSSFQEIITHSDKLKELRNQPIFDPEECRGCQVKQFCPRCPGVACLEDNSLTARAHEACRIAEIGHEVLGVLPVRGAAPAKELQ